MKNKYNLPISFHEQLRARLKRAEQLLKNIKWTGSHYQIIEKIEEYFKQIKKEEK